MEVFFDQNSKVPMGVSSRSVSHILPRNLVFDDLAELGQLWH